MITSRFADDYNAQMKSDGMKIFLHAELNNFFSLLLFHLKISSRIRERKNYDSNRENSLSYHEGNYELNINM